MTIHERLQTISKKKLATGIVVLVLVLFIPLITYTVQKQQEIRQRASGEQTELYFAQSGTTPVTSLSLTPNQQSTLSLYIDTKGNPVTGFDITISFPGGTDLVTINDLTEGADANKFNTPVFKTINTSTNTIRFAKVTTDTNSVISGVLHLGTAMFTPKAVGSGTVSITSATITTSLDGSPSLTVSKPSVPYTIAQSQAGEAATFFASSQNCSSQATSLELTTGQNLTLYLCLNSSTTPITGFDITASFGSALNLVTINSLTPGTDANRFTTEVFKNVDTQNGTMRFAKVTTDTTQNISGTLNLVTANFTVNSPGSGTISISNATVTGTTGNALTTSKGSLSYTITSSSGITLTPTPTPGQSATLTPSPSFTLTPTPASGSTATPTQTTVTSIPSPTPRPSSTPTPSFTPSPTPTPIPGAAAFTYTLALEGIGAKGGSGSPKKNIIAVLLELYNAQNTLVTTGTGNATYNDSAGTYYGQLTLPQTVPSGNYNVKIKANRYLKKQAFGIISLSTSANEGVQHPHDLSQFDLIPGDVDGNNTIDVRDWNILRDCGYAALTNLPIDNPSSVYNSSACSSQAGRANADLNDDGRVNLIDYNIYIRSLSAQSGD